MQLVREDNPPLCGAENASESVTKPVDSESDSDEKAFETDDDPNTDDDIDFTLERYYSDNPPESEEDTEDTEEEEEEEMAAPSGNEWKSKKGHILWSPTPPETLGHVPATGGTPGPTRYATSRISTLKSCFDLFLTEEIIKLLVDTTNVQGKRSIKDWKDLDATDMEAYIGILILAGVYRSRNESTPSLWDDHTGRAIFRATIPHCKFTRINSCVRFEDERTRPARCRKDKLAAFWTIWEKWAHRLPLLFKPGQDVCVDDQLVQFRGHCGFLQYMPCETGKYGIKVWVTCDVATSYAWKMQVSTEKTAGSPREVNQGMRVVLDMTEGLQGVNTVTCDRSFTSYALAEQLLKRKMTLVGTMWRGKPELPPQLLQKRHRAPRSSLFAFTKTHTAVSYVPKRGKSVVVLSTKHREPAVSGGEHRKPTIILDYDRCKGAVNNLNKLIGTYSCKRRASRWPLALFYHILDVSAFNAFVLWTAVEPSWMQGKTFRRRLFMEELGKMLVAPQILRRQHIPRTPAAAAVLADLHLCAPLESEGPEPGTGKRRIRRFCQFCPKKKTKVTTTCTRCNKYICKPHTTLYCSYCST
ncbi:uncharacterized protein LOC118330532 isoform X2 [Morone saxatilis]|uniref:uncharacterized protein LOC118330532 isoform X2 n=1 Tax=Morone saxatilis TaxID=34816 RepID=UPI0015E211A6|nr:uncharacterized protein LOC118330532 isoform X2 [Morone saxatilis]